MTILLAAPSGAAGQAVVYARDDQTGQWTKTVLAEGVLRCQVRSLGFHRDRVSGVDRVFAGSLPTGIVSGVHDPAAPGRIRWDAKPELAGFEKRPMSFGQCGGSLYVAIKPAILRRIDGPQPHWEEVYRYPTPKAPQSSGMRGLTAVPNPVGRGEVLLAALEGEECRIVRLDPSAQHKTTVDLDILAFLEQRWGRRAKYGIAAYNDMPVLTDPLTNASVHFIGLQVHSPDPASANSTWYLVRHLDGRYDLHEVPALPDARRSNPGLFGLRAILPSPFAAEKEQVAYFGGYDANSRPCHNTAWIYKGTLPPTPKEQPRNTPQTYRPSCPLPQRLTALSGASGPPSLSWVYCLGNTSGPLYDFNR